MPASLDRRRFLLGVAGASALSATGRRAPAGADSGPLQAIVTVGGKAYTFREADGEDLGDFRGPGFVQRCIRATHPDLPLTVFFRPDRDSDRAEVVFELGRLWGRANAEAANLDAYHVSIRRGGSAVAEGEVPRHWWFSAWRWQSAPRPIIRDPRAMIRAGLILPYGDRLARHARPSQPVRYAGPMDNAGITLAMPTTGDRPDIGPVTEWQADYIVTGSRAALASLLAQAEAAGSVPWHMRDEATGAPIDIFEHPTVHWLGRPLAGDSRQVKTTQTAWKVDDAHQPALAYIPSLLTGDPYYLEKLQFQATFNVGWTLLYRQKEKLAVLHPTQTRAYAWGLRTLAQLARITPEVTPRWLLPRSYWERMLGENLTYFTREYVEDPEPPSAVFRSATNQRKVGSWQEAFLATSLAWAVLLGHEGWRKAFEWKVGSTIALTSGKSGWPRRWCCPYYYKVRPSPSEPPYRSWAEAWSAFKAEPSNKVPGVMADAASWVQPNSFGFLFYTRAVLALAARLGVSEADGCLKFVESMAAAGLREHPAAMSYRWSIDGP